MADQTMLARRQIRIAALAALQGAIPETRIECPGDWTTPTDILPIILLRTPRDRKESITKTQPEFTTTVSLELEARIEANTAEAAQDAIELLGYNIEQALFTNVALISIIQQVASVDTETEITADSRRHLGGIKMTIGFEVFEAFEPTDFIALTGMDIHLDTGVPFDATGTYQSPAFPDAVNPAPRTSGPDGRDEGALTFTFPE
jgi:hypothetical protein